MYVRRAYTAYDVISVVQEELAPDITLVEWQFLLPQNHPNRLVTYRRASTASLGSFIGKVSYMYMYTHVYVHVHVHILLTYKCTCILVL